MAQLLLLEPDQVLANVFAAALETDGHQTMVAYTAQSAITAADRCKPDGVLLELQLINHSGIEFLYEFRSYTDWQIIPALVISQVPAAGFGASQPLLYERLGVRAYYYKPQLTLAMLRRAARDLVA